MQGITPGSGRPFKNVLMQGPQDPGASRIWTASGGEVRRATPQLSLFQHPLTVGSALGPIPHPGCRDAGGAGAPPGSEALVRLCDPPVPDEGLREPGSRPVYRPFRSMPIRRRSRPVPFTLRLGHGRPSLVPASHESQRKHPPKAGPPFLPFSFTQRRFSAQHERSTSGKGQRVIDRDLETGRIVDAPKGPRT